MRNTPGVFRIDDHIYVGYDRNFNDKGRMQLRPTVPLDRRDDNCEGGGNGATHHASCAYVIDLAGEFLQLTSNGHVPVCIHRVVVPPKLPAVVVTGTEKGDCGYGGCGGGGGGNDVPKYKPRVSSPMFLHLRRGQG